MTIWQRIKEDPAILIAMISATITAAVAFGLDLTDDQRNAILALAVAILGGGVWTRQLVTPEAKRLRKQREADRKSRPAATGR